MSDTGIKIKVQSIYRVPRKAKDSLLLLLLLSRLLASRFTTPTISRLISRII